MKAMEFSAFDLGEENKFCLIDANRGIYIPKIFAQRYTQYCVNGICQEQIDILLSGPDHDEYWNAWEEVVNEVEFLFDGTLCTLYENNDLFAVPVN